MRSIFSLLMFVCGSTAFAGDSIDIKINQLSFSSKDSIHFSCRIYDYAARGLAAATLNVWIQDVEKKQTWKFRYPLLNGELDASLAIGDSIPPGKYAVNFILQKGLYKIQGEVRNNYSHQALNYLMLLKGNKKLINAVDISPGGAFVIKNILFEDRSFIVFTPEKKVKKNDLFITISTPLDSAFTPLAIFTQVIDVKPELQKKTSTKTVPYKFNFEQTYTNSTLPEVIVISKGKTKADQYNEMYSTGLFQDANAKVFDGLETDDIANSVDIETFLEYKIPGLIVRRPDGGNPYMVWRNEPVVVYIDEFRLEQGDPIYIVPSDVAMIKVYPPPAAVNSGISTNPENPRGAGFSGAVAIYTKKGAFENNSTRRYKFNLKGYTGFASAWK
jgi:hypothetical protein